MMGRKERKWHSCGLKSSALSSSLQFSFGAFSLGTNFLFWASHSPTISTSGLNKAASLPNYRGGYFD